ncbi:hypothetical protein T09_13428 [Trichinella sp. T9]|nr:hypothetical protein T09_13428 [Trichinella sp. T9]
MNIHPAEENDHKWVIVLMPFTRSSCHAQLSSFLSKNNNGYGKLIQTNMLKNGSNDHHHHHHHHLYCAHCHPCPCYCYSYLHDAEKNKALSLA